MLFAQQPKQDSTQAKRTGWTGYPFIFYTPETKTGGGGAINYFFREAGSRLNARPSSLVPVLVYTQKQQISATLFADLYWKQEKNHLMGTVSYSKWPNLFYGIGNNTSNNGEDYTQRAVALDLRFLRQVRHGMYLGIQYQFLKSKLTKIEAGGQLARGDILGGDDGAASGVGAIVSWDTRDNIFNAASGGFYQLSARVFHDRLNSDFDFTTYQADLRRYFPVMASHVLAVQGYMNMIKGDPPFYMMSLLGGQNLMRGYYEGRYRDKNMIAVQMEYRLPVWKRIGAVGFAGFGEVAPGISDFELKSFKHTVGIGLRYLLVPAEKINMRLDFGWGRDSSGFYLALTEAF
jgi:outer membrane protein assembly factor BamA